MWVRSDIQIVLSNNKVFFYYVTKSNDGLLKQEAEDAQTWQKQIGKLQATT